MKPAIVYEAVNCANGKRYVGMTSQGLKRRRYQHETAARTGAHGRFYAALRKHGVEGFSWREIARLPTFDEAQIAERIEIALTQPAYNQAAGGAGALGVQHTPETRALMAASKRGLVKSAETRARISVALRTSPTYADRADQTRAVHTGLKRSVETCARISESRKGKPVSEKAAAANAARRGSRASDATRAKMSERLSNSEAAKAHRKRLVALHTGRKRSAETRARISAALKGRRRDA